MSKPYKLILILASFFVVLTVGFLIYQNVTKTPSNEQSQPNNNNQDLPEYFLGADEEIRVKEFVKNFASLYNSYRYADYTNLTALGDYQTVSMQEKTIDLISQLENTIPVGFAINTTPEVATFTYKYPEASKITASLKAEVEETQNENLQENFSPRNPEIKSNYEIKVDVVLVRFNGNWLVDSLVIYKN
jgi:hypothetical protein